MESKSNSSEEVMPKTVSIIAAAVTEFLGKKVRIRSVKMLEEPDAVSRWVRQGRVIDPGFAQPRARRDAEQRRGAYCESSQAKSQEWKSQ